MKTPLCPPPSLNTEPYCLGLEARASAPPPPSKDCECDCLAGRDAVDDDDVFYCDDSPLSRGACLVASSDGSSADENYCEPGAAGGATGTEGAGGAGRAGRGTGSMARLSVNAVTCPRRLSGEPVSSPNVRRLLRFSVTRQHTSRQTTVAASQVSISHYLARGEEKDKNAVASRCQLC